MNQNWFFLALIPPFLYAITNHIDKILLEKYFKDGGVGTLILFSSLLSILALPFMFLGDPEVLSVDVKSIAVLGGIAVLDIILLWFYLLALKEDESSVVIVFYQLVPVFGLILGYFILGEVISQMQFFAMAIIIVGTTIISFRIEDGDSLKLRKKTVAYMLIACLCWSLESVVFKAVALEENVWRSLFWKHAMLVILGAVIFTAVPRYRKYFLVAFKNNSKAILSLNALNETLYMLGNIVVAFTIMLAPVALVLLTETFQAIFVFCIGIVLTKCFPRISVETIEAKHLWQKFTAIGITGIGTYMLLTA